MQAALQVIFPCADKGIKIVLAIAFVGSRGLLHSRFFLGRVGILGLLRTAVVVRV
jgi:hypothetical protein